MMNFQHLDNSISSARTSFPVSAISNSVADEGFSLSILSLSVGTKYYFLILNPVRISRISRMIFFLYSMKSKGYELKTRHARESSDITRIAPLELDKDERTL